ncbi:MULTISPECIES: hypothetical protein [unclassified Crossiella]|uniref:hypothetical protein n=1 Tax=unclassified Crossiella TaxID=2620835 RepID=UPI001FFF7612|nr:MULTISPECIES: hypothetical protein [unclassified Crossiella]MCK2240034.1 hypothetical protein [Crossiella sp. S99.2]MCK2252742.1 hypothetical protein [Crossiella sp. S99.1]
MPTSPQPATLPPPAPDVLSAVRALLNYASAGEHDDRQSEQNAGIQRPSPAQIATVASWITSSTGNDELHACGHACSSANDSAPVTDEPMLPSLASVLLGVEDAPEDTIWETMRVQVVHTETLEWTTVTDVEFPAQQAQRMRDDPRVLRRALEQDWSSWHGECDWYRAREVADHLVSAEIVAPDTPLTNPPEPPAPEQLHPPARPPELVFPALDIQPDVREVAGLDPALWMNYRDKETPTQGQENTHGAGCALRSVQVFRAAPSNRHQDAASAALGAYVAASGLENESLPHRLTDLLTDLRHLGCAREFSVDDLLEQPNSSPRTTDELSSTVHALLIAIRDACEDQWAQELAGDAWNLPDFADKSHNHYRAELLGH